MWTFVIIVVPPFNYNKENAYLLITMIYLTKNDDNFLFVIDVNVLSTWKSLMYCFFCKCTSKFSLVVNK